MNPKRRANVVGILPDEQAIIRLVASILLAENHGWVARRARQMTLATNALSRDDPLVRLPVVVA